MTNRQDIENLLASIFERNALISATLSSPRETERGSKVTIRPILVKGKPNYQMTENRRGQAIHHNLTPNDCQDWLKRHLSNFKQTFLFTEDADYHILFGKKSNITLLKKAPSKAQGDLKHNRQKNYLLKDGIPVPFLIHLGMMNSEGKIAPSKKDKFRQINRFLEMIDDILRYLDSSRPIRIVDFGCGKAYLTFALHHFFKVVKGFQVQMIGLDLKKEVVEFCQDLSQKLGYQNDLRFVHGDINQYQEEKSVDLVVSLHACDTATDAALEKAIRWKSKVILCVPCCQHELLPQVQQEELRPLLKHGILKERFAALATDAARAQLLEVLGYQTQILEFIDVEHTSKNLLLRAHQHSYSKEYRTSAWQNYLKFKQCLNIDPSLERRFKSELKN